MRFAQNIAIARAFLQNAALFSGSALAYRQGDFFKIPIPGQRIFLVNDASVLEHVLVRQEHLYEKSRIYWKQLRQIIGKAMGSTDGHEWLPLRKAQNPVYTPAAVQHYLETITYESATFVQQLPPVINPVHDLALFNIQIVLKCVFGVQQIPEVAALYQHIIYGERLIAWRSKYPWRAYTSYQWHKNQKLRQSLHYISQWTNHIIEQHIRTATPPDLLQILLAHGSTPEEIRNELIVHLGASTETTAVAQAWALYLLATHPTVLQRVQQQLRDTFPNRVIEPHQLGQLAFLEPIIKETLRLYPPSHALVRDALADDHIQTTTIRPKDTLYISAFGIHRNPRYWQQPEAFLPERFEKPAFVHPYQYVPYGAGKHTCIGRYLAMPLMTVTLAHLLLHFSIELQTRPPVQVVSLSTLKPDKDILIKLTKLN